MRVFVIGNAAMDETLEVEAPPRPGASILARMVSRDAGGKGLNQAVTMARAGLDVTFAAPVGEDARAGDIAGRLAPEPLRTRLVALSGVATDASTILAMRQGENAIITTNAAAEALGPEAALAAMADAESGDLLVMQGNLSAETTGALLRRARALGAPVALNPSPVRPFFGALIGLADSVFVNEDEAAALGGPEALMAAGVGAAVLTLGAKGARLIGAAGEIMVPARPAGAVDATGAGDCFMGAALACAALRGAPLDARALASGAAAAAITVTRRGALSALPSPAEMAAIMAAG